MEVDKIKQKIFDNFFYIELINPAALFKGFSD